MKNLPLKNWWQDVQKLGRIVECDRYAVILVAPKIYLRPQYRAIWGISDLHICWR